MDWGNFSIIFSDFFFQEMTFELDTEFEPIDQSLFTSRFAVIPSNFFSFIYWLLTSLVFNVIIHHVFIMKYLNLNL